MQKKIIALAAALLLLLSLCSCAKAARFDYSELEKRLCRISPDYAFDYENCFLSDGVYYIYYSFGEIKNVLLTAEEDSSCRLTRLSLTLLYTENAELCGKYAALSEALCRCFVPGCVPDALLSELELYTVSGYFSDVTKSSVCGRYSLSRLSSCTGICFTLSLEA